jgi:hypothetical protein
MDKTIAYVISKENTNSIEGRPINVIIGDENRDKAVNLVDTLNDKALHRWESEGMPGKLPFYFFDAVDIIQDDE